MKQIFKLSLIALALTSAVSCELDLYPDTTLPYDESVPMIQTVEDISSYHLGVYADFRSCQSGSFKMADDLMFDAFNATQNFGNRYGQLHRLDASFTSSDTYVQSFWGTLYTAIKDYNVIIDQVPKASVDATANKDALDRLMADAKFARAWSYLQLARRFGKAYDASSAASELCVPLVTVYDQTARPARATVQQIYDQIKTDLDAAAPVLEKVAGVAKAQEFTVDALNCMYANYYLDVKDYAKAYTYAEKVIANTKYALCSTEEEFQAEYFQDAGKEAVMLLPVSLTELVGAYDEYINYNSDANSPTKDAYGSGYIPSQVLLDAYDVADLRRRNWFDDCRTIPFGTNGSYYQQKFLVFVKYKGNTALSSAGVIDGHVAPKPFSLPEMYLISAEAAFQSNQRVQALVRLNELQAKRKSATTSTISLEAIQKEWFKETVGDGLRMECLKRWGIGVGAREAQAGAVSNSVVLTSEGYTSRTLAADDYHFSWPIPAYEIQVNSNLVQNSGYSTASVD